MLAYMLVSLMMPTLAKAAVYDLSADFSPTNNPNGVWTFGAKPSLDGPLSVFGVSGLNPFQYWQLIANQEPTIYRNGTSNSLGEGFPPGTVFFYSGTDGASNGYGVVRFTVPADAAGEYHIEAAVRPVYDNGFQGDTDFHVVKNGTELFGRFLAPPDQSEYTNTLALVAGDAIDFMVGRGQDNSGVSSGLKIQVTITSSPVPPPRVRYDLSNDFSPSANPNGVWTFGAKPSLDGSLAAFAIRGLNPFQYWQLVANQEPTIYRNGTSNTITLAAGQGVFPPGTVFFYSGTDGATNGYGVVRFTVPPGASGEYHIETSVRPVYDGNIQGDTDFHVVKNGADLFGRFLAPPDRAGYSNALSLAAGDTVDFMVGRGQDNSGTASGLKIQLTIDGPPPVTPPPDTNCTPTPIGLVAWWPFDGNATDVLNGTTLQVSGSPGFVSGQVNQALRFDGVDDGAISPPTPALNVGAGEGFSIETWVNPAHVTMQPLVEWSPSAGIGGVHFWLGVYGAGSIYANVVDTSGGQHSWRSDTDIVVPNAFQHVGMSYDKASGSLRFYLNGRKVTDYQLGSFTPQTTYQMLIGHRLGQEHFAGLIDELSLYSRVLSDAEFAAIHAAGAAGKCRPAEPPPREPKYVLSQDFSATQNPSAPWSYGAKDSFTGLFSLFTIRGTVPDDTGRPFQYWQLVPQQEPTIYHNATDGTNRTAGGQGTFPPGTTFLYSGTDGAANQYGVVRFTAPADGAGNYEVTASASPVYDGPLQGDTDFHVLKNGIELFGRFLAGAQTAQFTGIVSLAAGDTVELVVGRGQDGSGYGSGLKIEAIIAPATNAPPPPSNFDLSQDFSGTDNPAGVWSYGAKPRLSGAFSLFGIRGLNPFEYWQLVPNQEPTIYRNGTSETITLAGGQGVFPPGTVFLFSGTDGVSNGFGVVRFTAPPGGSSNYVVKADVRPVYDGDLQGDTDFHVVKNGAEQFGRFLAPADRAGYSNILSLSAGDVIDFMVGRGRDRSGTSSGLKIDVKITPTDALPQPPHGNHAPIAEAEIKPTFDVWPDETSFLVIAANGAESVVSLDGSESSDPDNDTLEYFWIENGQATPFAAGIRVTNSFGLGEHVVTLVVSDGQDTGHDAVAFEVITLSDAVNELILLLTEIDLERRNKRPLLATLNAAWESFEDGDLGAGVKRLQVFQQKIRAQVAHSNPDVAERLVAGAQQIIDAVEALSDDHKPKGEHRGD